MSIFGVILVRIQSECGKIRTRITSNTDTFHVVIYTEKYDEWLETVGIQQGTDAGNLKPLRSTVVNWILDSWNQFSFEMIRKSFKVCALISAIDGSEDKDIHCFKEQPCHAGLEFLTQQINL